MPPELKQRPNWVLWVSIWNGSKWTKRPIQLSGFGASTTNPNHWSSFDDARQAFERAVEHDYIELREKNKPTRRVAVEGVGFVFDGRPDENGFVVAGVDFDKVISGQAIASLAEERIRRLGSYTERSVSRTGLHVIVKARPLQSGVSYGGVELYTSGRFFTMTGHAPENARVVAAPNEFAALAEELKRQAGHSEVGKINAPSRDAPFEVSLLTSKPAEAFTVLAESQESLSDGITNTPWFETLSPELKDQVVDYALGVIAKATRLLELQANGGNNAEYFKLTTSVARSGAPNAEGIFVKHASTATNADPDEELRQHFARCCTSQPSSGREITVGTLLLLAQQNGANFDQWKSLVPTVPALPPVTWSAADLQVRFSNIPHRKWQYGVDLVRGEITILGSPGGVGKSSLAIGMAVAIATGRELLGEKVHDGDDLSVLLINSEDTGTEIMRRIWAFCLLHTVAEQTLSRLYVAGVDDAKVQRLSFLRTSENNFSKLDRSGFQVLEAALLELRPDCIVLDPLVAFCGSGNMNDTVMSEVMRELKSMAAKFNCAVLVVHHNRKGGDAGNSR